ncbi:MAG: hypothetical protein R3F56_05060 [Planctomycetota bacterium]
MTTKLLEKLDSAAKTPDKATRQTLAEWRKELTDAAESSGLPQAELEPVLAQVGPHYAAADRLALQEQRRLRAMDITVALASVCGVAAGVLDRIVDLGATVPILIGGACAAVGLVFVLVRRARVQQRWVQARYISEVFRTAPFATLAGVDLRQVEHEAVETLAASPNPSPLLRDRLHDTLPTLAGGCADPHLAEFVRIAWFDHQCAYHSTNRRKKRSGLALARIVAALAFGASMVAAVVSLAQVAARGDAASTPGPISFLSTVLPAVATNALFLLTAREFARVSTRSGRMAREFAALAAKLPSGTPLPDVERVVGEAAEMALLEAYEWSVLLGSARDL